MGEDCAALVPRTQIQLLVGSAASDLKVTTGKLDREKRVAASASC
jgi:hypothetical protein